ncbi:MAG: phosphotransferase family protein [Bacilli bacterium]
MKQSLQQSIEKIIGPIHSMKLLPEQGWTSEVRKITTANGEYLLKTAYKAKYREWLKNEARILESNNTGKALPMPTYYGFVEDSEYSALLMSFESGTTLTSALKDALSQDEKIALMESFGAFLNGLHNAKPLDACIHNEDWLELQLARAQSYVNEGQTDASQALLDRLLVNKPTPITQCMIHGDCTTDNVFVRNGQVVMFIDVAGFTVGDPRYDLALATRNVRDCPEQLGAFFEGYTRYRLSSEEFQYFDEGLYEFF